jgi:hypothetical protein
MKKIILASIVLGLVAAGQVQAASYPLTAGRGLNVGTVDVTSDGANFFVSFNVDDGWVLGATELHIAGNLKAVPQRWGLLMPWRFMGRHAWLNCAKRDAYTFPVGDLGGKDVCVVAHAIIARTYRHRLQIEDTWAGADRFPGRTCARYIAIAADQWTTSGGTGWDVTGAWTLWICDGWYQYDVTLTQDAAGNITGDGWVMTADVPPQQDLPVLIVAGTVTEDGAVSMTIADAADTSAFFTITGSIADDGSMAGTCPELGDWTWWSDPDAGEAVQGGGGGWILP